MDIGKNDKHVVTHNNCFFSSNIKKQARNSNDNCNHDIIQSSSSKKVFLEYATINDARTAESELSGRQFGDSVVESVYFDEIEYSEGRLE